MSVHLLYIHLSDSAVSLITRAVLILFNARLLSGVIIPTPSEKESINYPANQRRNSSRMGVIMLRILYHYHSLSCMKF